MKIRRPMKTLTAALCALAVSTSLGAETLINGAGATFPYPIYSKWFSEYNKLRPEIRINYQPIGSGGGIRQLAFGTVDFGASDQPMTDVQLAKARIKPLHFPTVLGAIVVTYNVPEVKGELKLTPEALAGVFLGKIRKWNDPELARANPELKLPAADIVVVHRSDGSGTTYVWTDYLAKTNAEWKSRVGSGTAINWPTGLGAKGNDGVAGLVKQTPYSIGYVELTYAIQNRMHYARVRNAAGAFVRPELATVTAAAAGAAANMPDDFRVSITNAPGEQAYPISSFTWLLIPERIQDPAKKKGLIDFLRWMLGPGQKMAEPLSYAPLPAPVAARALKAISRIQ